MARTPSNMLPLGFHAPDFILPDPSNHQTFSLGELRGTQATLIMFICNHCPFVTHIIEELVALGNEYHSDALSVIAICSNDANNYPDDSPEKMVAFAKHYGFAFPYLHDESQSVAKAYNAACTPDFFLFDAELNAIYRGQFDDARPGSDIPVTGDALRDAIEDVLGGKIPDPDTQKPSLGCNIKWKAGN